MCVGGGGKAPYWKKDIKNKMKIEATKTQT